MAGLLDIGTLLGYIDRAKRSVATSAERIGSQGLLNALNSEGAYGMQQVEANPEAARQYFVEQAPGLLGVIKNQQWNDDALKYFGRTYKPSETGYILDKGERLDLSGRHYASGYEATPQGYRPTRGTPDYLAGNRVVDHRELPDFVTGDENWQRMFNFQEQTGAVRYMPDVGISVMDTNMPSRTQIETAVRDFRSSKTPLNVDVDAFESGGSIASKEFARPTVDSVMDFIRQHQVENRAPKVKLPPITDPTDGAFITARAAWGISNGDVQKALQYLSGREQQVRDAAPSIMDGGMKMLNELARAKEMIKGGRFK